MCLLRQSSDFLSKLVFTNKLEITCDLTLDPRDAPYLIIPCTFQSGQEAKFRLRVYTKGEVTVTPFIKVRQA